MKHLKAVVISCKKSVPHNVSNSDEDVMRNALLFRPLRKVESLYNVVLLEDLADCFY